MEFVLQRLETAVVFLAMTLAVVLEGALVYWIFQHPSPRPASHNLFNVQGEWTGIVLPQVWLFGALFVLAYRAFETFSLWRNWTTSDRRRHRSAFLRLWRWIVALITIQGFALFLGNTNAS